MHLSPHHHRRALLPPFPRPFRHSCAPLPSFLRRQEPNLANADQNLTKVDKGCQNLTPSTPASTPNPSKTQRNRKFSHHPDTPASTLAVNPSSASRTTLNNPEQP